MDIMLRSIRRLRLLVDNLEDLIPFYTQILGMQNFGSPIKPLLGYEPNGCLLEFLPGARSDYQHRPSDLYWKIGITLKNVDHAIKYLHEQGVQVSEANQFEDIGYLCHLQDPKGFVIELLQQGFEGREQLVESGHPISVQATLAHVTLRTQDMEATRRLCEGKIGMRLLSIQPVPAFDFSLFFFVGSSETPPDPDLRSVRNREWLWGRPYPLLEFQHRTKPAVSRRKNTQQAGFVSIGVAETPQGKIEYFEAAQF